MSGPSRSHTYGDVVNESPRELLGRIVTDLGGSERESQQEMVDAVAATMDDGGVLLVQAGTGTGKSLGYLAPAIAAARDHDKRTVIATATLALQRQLVERDVPAAIGAVSEADVSAAVLKGRGNYICVARLRGRPEDDEQTELDLPAVGGRLERQAAELREWAEETASGDRDDYTNALDPRVWRAVSATGKECVGPSKCPFSDECFSEQAKRSTQEADIVVTNHALLALDALDGATVLPEHDFLIVDEGHELASRVTSTRTEQLGAGSIERANRAARSWLTEGAAEHLTEASEGLEKALLELPQQRTRFTDLPAELIDALAALRDAAHLAESELTSGADGESRSGADSDDVRRHRAQAALAEIHDIAGRVLAGSAAASPTDVIWFGGDQDPYLYVAPLNVAGVIGGYLQEPSATVLTSATLELGGNFDAVADELGLGDSWQDIDVGSPFDYGQQGILYVASDLPKPGRDGPDPALLERLHDLVVAAGGRSLVLLSSWRAVERVADYLADNPVPDVKVMVQQRGDPVASLVHKFNQDETSVLVGTMSLFQGVDVPGRSCTCVIIDRIPFPRPDDPVLAARAELAEQSGSDGFMSVSMPRAALLLAQGSGRLIRTDSDRGVVAVLDPRLRTARYGRYLVESLPAFWPTTDTDAVLAALDRLAREPS